MTRLTLALRGPLQVTLDGAPVSAFEYNKVRALLAYLVLEAAHPHRREDQKSPQYADNVAVVELVPKARVVARQADRLATDDVSGAFVCGTTGEGMSLTSAERRALVEAWVTAAAGRKE